MRYLISFHAKTIHNRWKEIFFENDIHCFSAYGDFYYTSPKRYVSMFKISRVKNAWEMCNTGAHMSLFIVVILMLNSCQETIPVSTIDSRFLLLRTPTCKFASTYFWKLLYKLSKKRDIVNDTHTWEQMEWNIFRNWLIKNYYILVDEKIFVKLQIC